MSTNPDPLLDSDHASEDLLLHKSSMLQTFGYSPPPPTQIQQLSPTALAYIGDAVYELFIRRYYLFPPQRLHTYHQHVVAQVRAEAQAQHLQAITAQLTPLEAEWVKRGRNAVSRCPRRIDPDIYQQATSLETLIGYLYLTDPHRLIGLLNSFDLAAIEIN